MTCSFGKKALCESATFKMDCCCRRPFIKVDLEMKASSLKLLQQSTQRYNLLYFTN